MLVELDVDGPFWVDEAVLTLLADATPARGSADGGTGGLVVFSGAPRSGRGALAAHVLLGAAATSSVGTIEAAPRGPLDGVDQFVDERFYEGDAAARWRSIINAPSLDLLYVRELLGADAADLVVTAASRRRTRFLTTLQCINAPAVIARLQNMGIESWKIAAALRLVLQTARVRRLCPFCRTPVSPPSLVFERHQMSPPLAVCQPSGCLHCGNSGYLGWLIIAERLPVTDELQRLIVDVANVATLEAAARAAGWRTLQQHALDAAAAGEVSVADAFVFG